MSGTHRRAPGGDPGKNAPCLSGSQAEAGLTLLDEIERLRDGLACLSAQARKPGTPEMTELLSTMHFLCDVTEALTAVECEAKAVLAAGCGLQRNTPKTTLTRTLGAIVGEWADDLLSSQ